MENRPPRGRARGRARIAITPEAGGVGAGAAEERSPTSSSSSPEDRDDEGVPTPMETTPSPEKQPVTDAPATATTDPQAEPQGGQPYSGIFSTAQAGVYREPVPEAGGNGNGNGTSPTSSGSSRGSGSGNGNGNGNGNGHGGNGNGNGNGGDYHRRGNGNGNGNGNGGNGNGRYEAEMAETGQPAGRVELPGLRMQLEGFRLRSDELVTRPDGFDKKGFSGEQRQLLANYFTLQLKNNLTFSLYTVTFEPELDHERKRKALLRLRTEEVGPFLFQGTQFFTTRADLGEIKELHDVGFEDKPAEKFKITLRFLRVCQPNEQVVQMCYNTLLRQAQKELELTLMGRHYFDSHGIRRVPAHKLELWPGYIVSMKLTDYDSPVLNVDMTFKVCRTESVLDIMRQIRQQDDRPGAFERSCNEAFLGVIVMTPFNKKTYRVDEIDFRKNPTHTFERTRKGETRVISFIDYYAEKGVPVNNRVQPLLISYPTRRDIIRGDTGNKLLVPEICFQTGLTEEMRANFRLMKDLGQYLHMPPQERLNECARFVRRIIDNPAANSEYLSWGMKFPNSAPLEVTGRKLPKEVILFQNESTFTPDDKADWSQAFRNSRMAVSKPMRNWVIFYSNRDAGGIEGLIQTMNRVGNPLGFPIPQPQRVVTDGTKRSFEMKIREFGDKHMGKVDMVTVILPNNKLDCYQMVKQTCSQHYGVPSQCFLSKNLLNKGLMSICTKLVIQMNAKLGGEPWRLKNPLQGAMVVGFDVHHAKGSTSVGAMCATMTQNLAGYYSTIVAMERSPEATKEISSRITGAMKKCLKAYCARNGNNLPTRIFFYRDGVGEGQLQSVIQEELGAMRRMIEAMYAEQNTAKPKFVMIVTTKRIDTRLFLKMQGRNVVNPEPGTVCDDVVTNPLRYDFYLIPQMARQGTVSPTSFNVIHDESGLDADKIQRFSYKLCHGYFNWSGAVAVPAPCQYAHKLAFLTGTALQGDVHESLVNNLHYL